MIYEMHHWTVAGGREKRETKDSSFINCAGTPVNRRKEYTMYAHTQTLVNPILRVPLPESVRLPGRGLPQPDSSCG